MKEYVYIAGNDHRYDWYYVDREKLVYNSKYDTYSDWIPEDQLGDDEEYREVLVGR